MSLKGVAATELLMQDTRDLLHGLRDEDWTAESAAQGWRVQDVIVHMASFCNLIADPQMPTPEEPSGTAERLNDALVNERRDWTPQQALEYYETQAAAGLATLTALQGPEYAEATMPLAELGTYRLAELSNAMAFDHFVHLSSDILKPRGPVDRAPIPADAVLLEPTLDWMLSGLPNMCADALRGPLTRPLGFDLTGPGARSFVLSWSDEDRLQVTDSADLPEDVVRSSAFAFTRWSTTRTSWQDDAEISGDRDFVAGVLNAINIV